MQVTSEQKTAWTDPEAIRQWWSSPSQRNFHRPWSAELISDLRSPFVEFWPSSEQGVKLRETFRRHKEAGTTSLSFGATDAITSHLMADAGYDSVYVSGATCSILDNTTQDFGADLADYPHDTVPKKTYQLFRSQLFQAKVASVRKARGDTAASLAVDRMVPLIADADTGHGGQTANMKLAKLFVESGAAAIHLDDQVSGTKKFGAKTAGRVLVPVEEHITRLLAVKMQFDVMGVETILIHRTDAETAGYLTSTISPVDRPYILGATSPATRSLVPHIATSAETKAQAESEEDKWVAEAGLMTLDEAVKQQLPDKFEEFSKASKGLNVSDALRVGQSMGLSIKWDADAARSREGWYRFRGSILPAIDRAIQCAKYADVLWTRTPATVMEDLEKFAKEVTEAVPGALLAYNLAADVKGSADEIKGFTSRLAKMGYVWQFLPLAGLNGTAVGANIVVKAFKDDGILGYIESVLKPGKASNNSILDYAFQGGPVADVSVGAVNLWK